MKVEIVPDISRARVYLRRLDRVEIPRVIGRSLNRTLSSTQSRASRLLRERINLQKAVIDKAIAKRRSNEIGSITALQLGRAWFELRFSGKPFPLRDFQARQTRRGVTFKVGRSGGRSTYERQGQKGFIVNRLGAHVFVRTGPEPPGPARAGIKKVYGPSIPQFVSTQRIRKPIIKHAIDTWAVEVERNAKYALSRRSP